MGGSLVAGIYNRAMVLRVFRIGYPKLKHRTRSASRDENAIQPRLISNLKPDRTRPSAFPYIFRRANDLSAIQRLGGDRDACQGRREIKCDIDYFPGMQSNQLKSPRTTGLR